MKRPFVGAAEPTVHTDVCGGACGRVSSEPTEQRKVNLAPRRARFTHLNQLVLPQHVYAQLVAEHSAPCRAVHWLSNDIRRLHAGNYGHYPYLASHLRVYSCSPDDIRVCVHVGSYHLANLFSLVQSHVVSTSNVYDCTCGAVILNIKQWIAQCPVYGFLNPSISIRFAESDYRYRAFARASHYRFDISVVQV